MDNIKYSSKILIHDVFIKWLPKIELFYPDLPGFPIMYVHVLNEQGHVYGFPVAMNVVRYNSEELCDVEFVFLCNKDLDQNNNYKALVQQELENRIGLKQAISREDIINACQDEKYKPFLGNLFDICSNLYGSRLPYGHFFEEIYSIVRYVAAFLPKTGRQSEMRMLYNFLSAFGEKIQINIPHWSFLEFYVLPTYNEVLNRQVSSFPKFSALLGSISKLWQLEFTQTVTVDDVAFHGLSRAWPVNEIDFRNQKLIPLANNPANNFSMDDVYQIERLVDAFNRHGWRASYFIWSICTMYDYDYTRWTKEFFENFYSCASEIKGCSEKVVACFLQQGFANKEIIPIDTWIKTFYEFALGIPDPAGLFNSFRDLGKIERLIWLTSQANKTNIREYMELLWCQRFGTNNNEQLRGINPLACYECKLHSCCCGYELIEGKNLLIVTNRSELSEDIKQKALEHSCAFICFLDNNVPKQIYKQIKKRRTIDYLLTDSFSGRLLNTRHQIHPSQEVMTVRDFLALLPLFSYSEC